MVHMELLLVDYLIKSFTPVQEHLLSINPFHKAANKNSKRYGTKYLTLIRQARYYVAELKINQVYKRLVWS